MQSWRTPRNISTLLLGFPSTPVQVPYDFSDDRDRNQPNTSVVVK